MPNEVRERTVYKHKTTRTTQDLVTEVKHEQEFSLLAALLQITYREHYHDVKTEKYAWIFAIIINEIPNT